MPWGEFWTGFAQFSIAFVSLLLFVVLLGVVVSVFVNRLPE